MPVLLHGKFGIEPPKFSEFILYTKQNMYSSYVCWTRIFGVARGFEGQNLQKYTQLSSLKRKRKIHQFPHFSKYKHLCKLPNVQTPDKENYLLLLNL